MDWIERMTKHPYFLVMVENWQVMGIWEEVKESYQKAARIAMTDKQAFWLLEQTQHGDTQVWMLMGPERNFGFMATTFVESPLDGERSLLVLFLALEKDTQKVGESVWMQWLGDLKIFAKAKNCTRIEAVTHSSRLTQVALQAGATVDSYIRLGLD